MEAPKHFDPDRERWEDWLQQYSWYETAMEMKKKEPEVQIASFMTIIGSDAQKMYRTFVLSPEETKKVEEIKKRFTNYFLPKKNYTMERNTIMYGCRKDKQRNKGQQRSDQEVSVIKKNFRSKQNVTMEEVPKLIDNCKKCGGTHPIRRCPAYGKICKKCKKANHFAKCCRSNFRYKKKINTIEEEGTENDEFSLQIN
ncbi:hypothetical protein LAZ67_14001842 [Cordylochernes scorpioides]|uniref:Uncharacterized protein n=1 Tax=Cordylochernes scorpioides TaxID=51811 RepID=A0ABY6L6C6_9ARAC|nr:hypothetical protein LAZ67_14001842 [Cordylochernes scorpioides]